jgi:hypothetical protein
MKTEASLKTPKLGIIYEPGRSATAGQGTLDKIEHIAGIFAARLNESPEPEQGDAIRLIGHNERKGGRFAYEGGCACHDSWGYAEAGQVRFCTQPYAQHVHADGLTECSGGYFGLAPASKLKHIGTTTKKFWTWGDDGPRGDGGVYFWLEVNQWEFEDPANIY